MRSTSINRLLSPAARLLQRAASGLSHPLGSGVDAPFEAMEDRRLLAAATVPSTTMQATQWLIVVEYTDPQGINTSTLGNNDIRVTGPNGYNQLGTYQYRVQTTPGSNNSIRAVYAVPAPHNAWNFTDNGAYTVQMEPNSVSDTTGETVPANPNMRTFNLSFSTPRAQVLNAYTTGDQFVANIRYSDNRGIDAATIGFGEVGLRRSTDPNNVQFFRSQTFFQNSDGSWTVTYRLPAIGGAWDFTDNGTYALIINGNQVRDLDSPSNAIPAQTLGTFNLWFSNPKADFVSTSTSANDWIIKIRYSDPNGIDLNSIGTGDIAVTNGIRTEQGVPIANATQESATSIVVTYRLRPDRYAWGAGENGTYLVYVNQGGITDSTGVPINRANIRSFNLFFDQPSISRPPATSGANSSSWEMTVTYTDNTGMNLASIGNGDLVAVGPSGYFSLATLVSKTTRVDAQGRTVVDARYRFFAPIVSGTYNITMRANEVLDTNGHPVTSFQWASYNIVV